jgi:hypothetical protein
MITAFVLKYKDIMEGFMFRDNVGLKVAIKGTVLGVKCCPGDRKKGMGGGGG